MVWKDFGNEIQSASRLAGRSARLAAARRLVTGSLVASRPAWLAALGGPPDDRPDRLWGHNIHIARRTQATVLVAEKPRDRHSGFSRNSGGRRRLHLCPDFPPEITACELIVGGQYWSANVAGDANSNSATEGYRTRNPGFQYLWHVCC
jgi:hypothetical protein